MCTTKTPKNIASPNAGDGGEAMAGSLESFSVDNQEGGAQLPKQEQVIPCDAGWYVAVVRCNCELKIADDITREMGVKGIWFEYWVPMHKVWYIDRRTNKRRRREKVFLTTFIFCHVSKRKLNEIRFRPDIYKMLTMPGNSEIYRIPDSMLANYRQLVENPDIPVVSHSGPLKKGQKVRVTEGSMAGLEAYVQRISGKKAVIGSEIKYISGATIVIDRALLKAISEE